MSILLLPGLHAFLLFEQCSSSEVVSDASGRSLVCRYLTARSEKVDGGRAAGELHVTAVLVHYLQFNSTLKSVQLSGWLGQAMVLGSFQCRGVLLLRHMVRHGPAVLAAGAGWVGYVFYLFFIKSRLSYLPFPMPHLLGDGWTS